MPRDLSFSLMFGSDMAVNELDETAVDEGLREWTALPAQGGRWPGRAAPIAAATPGSLPVGMLVPPVAIPSSPEDAEEEDDDTMDACLESLYAARHARHAQVGICIRHI